MTGLENLKAEVERLSSAVGLATNIREGFCVAADDGQALAVVANAPFTSSRDEYIFAAWMRDTLSDPAALAAFVRMIADETTGRTH